MPVVYSSPYRQLSLNCSSSGHLSEIFVGVGGISRVTAAGTDTLEIQTESSDEAICNLSTLQATETPNVYECVLDPPVTIGENSSVHIHQRYATRQIAFLHDGERDTPLISVNIMSE